MGVATGDGPGDEGVEGVVCDEEAVEELGDAGQHEEEHEAVDELEAGGGCTQRVRAVSNGRVGGAATCVLSLWSQ